MNCKKCMYCIQVSANEYKVKCANNKIAENKNQWVDEPSHCAFYHKGCYTDYIIFEGLRRAIEKTTKEADN